MTIEDVEDKSLEKENRVDTFWGRNGANIGLAALVIYVILLLIGTVAEIFNIDSILNWWIFRPPGHQ
jgi:hypothetical protein